METDYIDSFTKATLLILEKTASIRGKAEKPYVEQNDDNQGDVSSVIGFTGDVSGTFSISFKDSLLVKISSHILGKQIAGVTDEVIRVITQLTDLISDEARKEFERGGKVAKFATPTVFAGSHKLMSMAKGSKTSVYFKTDTDNFRISICLGS